MQFNLILHIFNDNLMLYDMWVFILSFLDLTQRGKSAEAEAEFEKLLGGGGHVKVAMADLSKLDKGDEADVKFAELICGRHYKGLLSLLSYD